MAKPKPVSAGVLFHRRDGDSLEVLVVHPSGAYNRNAPWSIPKGLAEPGEDAEQAARREALEETGLEAHALVPLGSIDYRKSRKTVMAFATEASSSDVPRCASWEIDRAEFVPVEKARELLHEDQRPFLDRLLAHLAAAGAPGGGAT